MRKLICAGLLALLPTAAVAEEVIVVRRVYHFIRPTADTTFSRTVVNGRSYRNRVQLPAEPPSYVGPWIAKRFWDYQDRWSGGSSGP